MPLVVWKIQVEQAFRKQFFLYIKIPVRLYPHRDRHSKRLVDLFLPFGQLKQYQPTVNHLCSQLFHGLVQIFLQHYPVNLGAENESDKPHKDLAFRANSRGASITGYIAFHCLLRMNTQASQSKAVFQAQESLLYNILVSVNPDSFGCLLNVIAYCSQQSGIRKSLRNHIITDVIV